MKIRCYFSLLWALFSSDKRGKHSKILKVKTNVVRFWYEVSSCRRTWSNSGVSKSWYQRFLEEIWGAIQLSKGKAAYYLIAILVPKIVKLGNYLKYSKCSNVFWRVDCDMFQRIGAWVYERHATWGRDKIKQKYFPKNKSPIFGEKSHQDNWILCDSSTTALKENFVELRFGFRSCIGHLVNTQTQTWTWLAWPGYRSLGI
jgi:hypothetical protein